MKRIFKGHIYFGRMLSRDDEFIRCVEERPDVRPTALRWFCGMGDLNGTFIGQAL